MNTFYAGYIYCIDLNRAYTNKQCLFIKWFGIWILKHCCMRQSPIRSVHLLKTWTKGALTNLNFIIIYFLINFLVRFCHFLSHTAFTHGVSITTSSIQSYNVYQTLHTLLQLYFRYVGCYWQDLYLEHGEFSGKQLY